MAFLIQQHVLGYLQLHAFRRDAGHIDCPRNSGDDGPRFHLGWRQIDRDAEVTWDPGRFEQRLVNDPISERDNQSGLLGHGKELAGRDDATPGVAPAQQRLVSGYFAGREIGDRLVIEIEFAAVQGFAEIHLDLAPFARGLVHARIEDRQAVAPFFLGDMKRHIRTAQQFISIAIAIEGARYPDAGGDAEPVAVDHERRPHDRQEAMRAFQQQAVTAACREQDGELVPAEPRDCVLRADFLLETHCDFAKERVTDRVPPSVVDRLEFIEIDIEQRRIADGGIASCRQRAKPVVEEVAIGEAGQAVIMRHEGDALLDLPRFGNVPGDTAHAVVEIARPGRHPPISELAIDLQGYGEFPERFTLGDTPGQCVTLGAGLEKLDKCHAI